MPNATPPVPIRAIGVLSLTAVSVNTVIGAGIFATPGTVAQLLGSASLLGYLLAGTAVLLIALCFADAGSRFESTGGPYVYARAAFGDFAGFQVGWLFVLARLTAVAAVSNTFSDYLGYFWPWLNYGVGRWLAITAMVGGLAGVHCLGVRLSTAVNNWFTIGKLVPLGIFCISGLFLLDWKVGPVTPLPPANSLQQASLLLLFAMSGFENASIPGEEVVNPKRALPIALLASVGSVIVLYLAIQVVAMAALPDLAGSATPLASAALFLGPAGPLMLTAGAVLSTAGSNHVNLFVGPRMLYAQGRDGRLPARFAWLHPRYRTPTFSIVLYALAGWFAAVFSAFAQLAALSAFARLLVYTSTCLAALVLRHRMPVTGPGFKLPFGAVIPVCALGVCGWLLAGTTLAQAGIVLLAAGVGAVLYASVRRG